MLVITFDEHGGCYDHVPPPAAPCPEPPRTGQAFSFDRFGVRVPAIVVSPFVRPGTVFRAPEGAQPFDHTTIIKTLRKRFGIDTPLTARDKDAPDLEQVLTLTEPSNEGRELVNAAPVPRDEAALVRARMAPLNDFQKALHESASYLHPLGEAESVTAHIERILEGWLPTPKRASSSTSALSYLRQVLQDIGAAR
jgi:phospholipase C